MAKEYKASYVEAVKDRALSLIGKGVHAVQSSGAGATIKRRTKDIDAAVDSMAGAKNRQTTDHVN